MILPSKATMNTPAIKANVRIIKTMPLRYWLSSSSRSSNPNVSVPLSLAAMPSRTGRFSAKDFSIPCSCGLLVSVLLPAEFDCEIVSLLPFAVFSKLEDAQWMIRLRCSIATTCPPEALLTVMQNQLVYNHRLPPWHLLRFWHTNP